MNGRKAKAIRRLSKHLNAGAPPRATNHDQVYLAPNGQRYANFGHGQRIEDPTTQRAKASALKRAFSTGKRKGALI